jgi:hypothetical protein
VLSPALLAKVQYALQGKGVLLYVPAVAGWYEPPFNLRMVHDFTARGWTAGRIADRLSLTLRQVYRLRKIAREHPERLQPQRPHGMASHGDAAASPTRKTPAAARNARPPRPRPTRTLDSAPRFASRPKLLQDQDELVTPPHLTFEPITRTDW